MNSASVGFQCPDCIKQGTKSTRSGRTAYGGQRSENPALSSQILVGLNAAVWLLIMVTGYTKSDWIQRLALIPENLCVAIDRITCVPVQEGVAEGATWQLVTTMFTHVEPWHLGFNMLALWTLGPQLELALGRSRFLALYFLSGLTASATIYWLSEPHGLTVGASGAIMGLLGALLVVAYKVSGNTQSLLGWVGFAVLITFFVPDVSWQGHLGGFTGGALIAILLAYAPKKNRAQVQWVGLAFLTIAILVAIMARTAVLTG